MKRLILLAPAALLFACDSGPDVDMTNASVEQVANQVRAEGGASGGDAFVRPGKWRASVRIEDVAIPGMPADMAAQMRSRIAQASEVETCLNPEDVKRPSEDFFAAQKNCRYDHFRMGDGRIDAKMTCTHQGMTQQMEMEGSYGPDNYRMTTSMRTEAGGPGAMTMKTTVESRRIGECDGTEQQRSS